MVTDIGNGHGARVQILDETVHISQSANTTGKSKNLIILPPALDK